MNRSLRCLMMRFAPGSGWSATWVFYRCQVTVAVGVDVRIRETIRQVGKQVQLVVVEKKLALLLLHGVYLKTNSQICCHAYSNRNSQTHLVEFGSYAAIDHIGKGSTIVHAQVFLLLEALDLGARHTLCHRLVPHIYRVVHPWGRLECVAHGE